MSFEWRTIWCNIEVVGKLKSFACKYIQEENYSKGNVNMTANSDAARAFGHISFEAPSHKRGLLTCLWFALDLLLFLPRLHERLFLYESLCCNIILYHLIRTMFLAQYAISNCQHNSDRWSHSSILHCFYSLTDSCNRWFESDWRRNKRAATEDTSRWLKHANRWSVSLVAADWEPSSQIARHPLSDASSHWIAHPDKVTPFDP